MIRDMIYDESYIPLKLKELAFLMDVPKEDRGELKEVMDALVEDGSVVCTARGKYIRPENRNLEGLFTRHPRGFGFVTVPGEPEDIFVPAEYVGDAFHKDQVIVKVTGSQSASDRRPEGKIIKIVSHGIKSLAGTFMESGHFGFVIPDDPRCGTDIYIPKKYMAGARSEEKVVVRLRTYGEDGKKPEGEVEKILGHRNDPGTEIAAIEVTYGLEERFSKAVRRQAGSLDQTINADQVLRENNKRADFRNLLTVTIDGEDARDLDDAITIRREGEGYVLGVHIADVSEYVTEGTPLDQEALERGTSVYFPDRVIPMLPRALSNGICSLNAGEDRLALSCVMTIDKKGAVIDHRITESLIHVDRRMSYTGVQAILDALGDPSLPMHPEGDREEIREMCSLMAETAGALKESRRRRGSIDFDFPESKILVDEKGHPTEIHPYARNTATDLIEDFMLLANQTVAEDYFWQELPFLYRTHEEPDEDKIRKLNTFIHNFGRYMKTGREHFHPKEIQKLLLSLAGEPEEALISRLALRSMKRAKYTTDNLGHFALSTSYYTHFTSPIRRYPDLQIHRIIKENLHGRLNGKRISHYEEVLPEVAAQCSSRERNAQDAEREVIRLLKTIYMADYIGKEFEGVISGVTGWGLYVELDNTVEGLVPIHALLDDYYIFDEENYRLIGEDTGRTFMLGQKVDVIVAAADPVTRKIDFVLKEWKEAMTWQNQRELS